MSSRQQLDLLRRATLESNFDGVESVLASIQSSPRAQDRVVTKGLRFALWWAGVEGGEPVEISDAQSLASMGQETRTALSFVSVMGARSAFVGFDQPRLEGWIELLGAVSAGSSEMLLRLQLAEAWLGILKGPQGGLLASCETLIDACRSARLADGLVDAQTSRALVAFGLGDKEDGLDATRRACRMAKAEALPQQELFAHLVLARLRRSMGTPYLASRILRSLAVLCPGPLRPWLEWEHLLAGAKTSGFAEPRSPSGRAALALRDLLGAALKGQREPFEDAFSTAASAVSGFLDGWLELQDLAVCLDVYRDAETGSISASEWVRGGRAQPPHGLQGTGSNPKSESLATVAYVAAIPGLPARRVLSLGGKLASTQDTIILDRQTRPQERTDTAASTLLLSHHGTVAERTFFNELYGFEYDVALHKQVLDSLVHRLRERFDVAATVKRADGTLTTQLLRPLLLWDPRCQRSLADTVLDTLARTGPMTARDAAAAVGVSLRTVQSVLSDMTDTDACVPRRSGRRVEYEVEDTVFSELTRERFIKG